MSEGTITLKASIVHALLRRDYLDDPRWVISSVCADAGHPAKIERPYETKDEWQRGCVCGRQGFV